jgi:hypothetical protein
VSIEYRAGAFFSDCLCSILASKRTIAQPRRPIGRNPGQTKLGALEFRISDAMTLAVPASLKSITTYVWRAGKVPGTMV